jgi:tetratricopeptide (TPR) repeat protein
MSRDSNTWGLARDARTALFGRGAEMSALDEAFEAVQADKKTRVITLLGPAGIGKSRLVRDFFAHHPDYGSASAPRVYRGSARVNEPSFGIFGRLLRARFGLVEGMDPPVARAQVRSQVSAVLEDRKVGDVVYFLGQYLGLPFEESPLTRAVSESPNELDVIRRAVFKAFLDADAAGAPTCLVFDDLHAAHDDSLALLRYLLEYLSGPILVICLARPELLARLEDWPRVREGRHRVLEIPALPDSEAEAMMSALLVRCEGGAPRQLIKSACAFAVGNPLLLQQVVRVYHDKGVLEEAMDLSDPPLWHVNVDKLDSVELPLTIEDAVNARLAALDVDERILLEQGAAMGSVFWSGAFVALARMGREAPEIWSELTGDDARAISATLHELVERDYILKLDDSTFPGSEEYVFKHNRERETIHKRSSRAALRRYHQGIADWMDQQEAVRSGEEFLAMLADHRERSGDAVRAGLAYLEAGDFARGRYAAARASEYYQTGLGLLGDGYVARRIDALHNYGDTLQLVGRIDDALAAFREMLTLAYRLDLRSKGGASHNRIGRVYRDIGSLDEAARHLSTAMALFSAEGDERGVASSIDDLGKLHWLKGEYEPALAALYDGLSRRRRLADRRSIALSLNNLGLVLQDSGKFKQALDAFSQSLLIRREIGDLVGVVTTLNNLGTILQDQRDFTGALRLFNEALDVATQIGDRNRTAIVLTNIGEAHYRTGSPTKAIEVLEQAEDLCDELGDKLGLAETLRGLGKAYLLQGDLAKARDCIGRAVDLFAAVRSKVHLGMALRTLGEITAAGGWGTAHTRSAREYFTRAASIFEQTGNELELARTFKVYARFLVSTHAETPDDHVALREAEAMNARADAVFSRLQISSGAGIDDDPSTPSVFFPEPPDSTARSRG